MHGSVRARADGWQRCRLWLDCRWANVCLRNSGHLVPSSGDPWEGLSRAGRLERALVRLRGSQMGARGGSRGHQGGVDAGGGGNNNVLCYGWVWGEGDGGVQVSPRICALVMRYGDMPPPACSWGQGESTDVMSPAVVCLFPDLKLYF